jgi:lactoylglutathione lyase
MNETSVLTDLIPVRHLFETHLTVSDLQRSIRFYRDVIGLRLVSDLQRSIRFYRDVIGLRLAFQASEQNAAFFWIGDSGRSMLGIGRAPLGFTLHLSFEVVIDDLLHATKRLKTHGIKPLSFFGLETTEPSVICWMPAASVYFRDPDGNMLEYIAMLEKEPRPV